MTPELSSSGLPAKETEVLVGFYRDAAKRLRKVVFKPSGRTDAAKEFRRARAAVLVGQVDQIVTDLTGKASGWVGKRIPKAAVEGRQLAEKQATEAGVAVRKDTGGTPVPQGSFHLIDRGTVRVFARDVAIDAMNDLSRAAQSMGETAKKVLRETAQIGLSDADINKVLAGGVITGQPVQTIRALREQLRQVHGEEVTAGKMTFDVGYYAAMVARTRTRQATVQARHERLQELDLDLVAIVGRISKNFCSAFLGQVFSLGGKSGKYPALSSLPGGGPPFHPNCSKSTRPYVEALASEKQQRLAEGLDDAGKLLNADPATAQRRFKDLQLYQEVKDTYASTAAKLFGKAA